MRSSIPKVNLNEVCRPKQWPTISQSKLTKSGYPVFGANGRIGYYTEYNHEHPTILITCRGATCGTINVCESKSYVTGNAMALDDLDTNRVDLRYTFYALQHRGLRDAITGTAQPQITRTSLAGVEIPFPPLSEQKRIADILDKADAIRRKRQEVIPTFDELIRAEFKCRFGDPRSNSMNWPTMKLGELLSGIDSGWSPTCHDEETPPNKWGVLKLGAVTTCKYLQDENKRLPADKEPRPDIEVKPGDLLMSRKNTYELVAATALVQETRPKLMLPDLVFRLQVARSDLVIPHYLWGLFTEPGKRLQIQRLASGSSGSMPNISKARLNTLSVEVPPLERQLHFASVLDHIHGSSGQAVNINQEADDLFNSLVQRAFRGNL